MSDSSALLPPVPTQPAVAQAFKQLVPELAEVPKMPERMFVEHVLPILANPPEPGQEIDLSFWLDIAGTPLRAIDIVDDTGNVLFRCPPLMRTLPTVYQQEVKYAEMIMEARAHEQVHPVQADRYMANQLSKIKTHVPKVDLETAKQWNAIRLRYGLEPILGSTTSDLTVPNSGTVVLEDDQEDF